MKLKELTIEKTGCLKELVIFEKELAERSLNAIKLFNSEKLKLENEFLERERKAKHWNQVRLFIAVIISFALVGFIIINAFSSRTNNENSNGVDNPSGVYYVSSDTANLVINLNTNKVAYKFPRGTALSITATGKKYYSVDYNGTNYYVLASQLSSTPPQK